MKDVHVDVACFHHNESINSWNLGYL